jgi:hypothetical protein
MTLHNYIRWRSAIRNCKNKSVIFCTPKKGLSMREKQDCMPKFKKKHNPKIKIPCLEISFACLKKLLQSKLCMPKGLFWQQSFAYLKKCMPKKVLHA